MLLKVCFLLSLLQSVVTGFPFSAGYCGAGIEGIGPSAHTTAKLVKTGELSTAGFELYIGGERVYKNFKFCSGLTHKVELRATTDVMRGFLMRLSSTNGENTKEALATTDSNAQIFDMCLKDGVGGLSHVSDNSKTNVTGTLHHMPSFTGSLTFDVTTVISWQFSHGSAEWFFSQFNLQANAPGTVISNAAGFGPTASPTNAPCASEAGAYCIENAGCCTNHCIRAVTNAISAPGYSDTSSSSSSISISSKSYNSTSSSFQTAPPGYYIVHILPFLAVVLFGIIHETA